LFPPPCVDALVVVVYVRPSREDLTAERMEELVETTVAVRSLLARYIDADKANPMPIRL
jgi:hypothetical protein